jgi:beta-lactamase regulating signal transducer with metallopeptidase domain
MSISTELSNTIIESFSWMLVHSLWQGAIVAIAAGIILMATKKTILAIRYNLILMLFAVFLLTTIGTFIYELNGRLSAEVIQGETISSISSLPSLSHATNPQSNALPHYKYNIILNTVNIFISHHAVSILILWFLFFIIKSATIAGNMAYMYRARYHRVFDPSIYWQEKITSLCEKLQLKKAVLLLESGYLKVPVVIGYFKPVILMPVGLLSGIPTEQVEAVLLHELAHIKRSDYAVNFLQSIAEAVFFFNPGLLWVSSILKEERENCCDDIAIALTNNKEEFVQALISFKEHSLFQPAHAIAFSGQKSSLLNRVMRIVYQENKTLSIKENGIFIAGIALLSLMAFTIYPVKNGNLIKHVFSNNRVHNDKPLQVIPNSIKTPVNELNDNSDLAVFKAPVNADISTNYQRADTVIATSNNFINESEKTSSNNIQQLIDKVSFDDGKFYSRLSENDIVQVLTNNLQMMVSVKHNAKVAIIINGQLYNENQVANFTRSQIDSYPGSINSVSETNLAKAQKMYPDLDLSKYGACVLIGADPKLAATIKGDSP